MQRFMKSVLFVLVMLALSSSASLAGPNANGAIIVHTSASYTYSSLSICTSAQGWLSSCEDAITTGTKCVDGSPITRITAIWFEACFPYGANPVVSSVYFGTFVDQLNLDAGTRYGFCGPHNTIQTMGAGWPHNAGATVQFGSPVTGYILFRFYYFGVDNLDCDPTPPNPYWCSAVHPDGGYAAFYDDAVPPNEDRVTRFGCVKWYEPGYNDCPPIPGVCCDPVTGMCLLATYDPCPSSSWELHPEWTTCEPNPCSLGVAACCDPTGACALTFESDCPGPSIWHPEWTSCQPNPCPMPPEQRVCCRPNGMCDITVETNCSEPAVWHPEWTSCTPNLCPWTTSGPNANGSIVVHTNDAYSFSASTVCTTTLGLPPTCDEALTRSDKATGAVVWFLAAFPPTSMPSVAGIYLGVSFDEAELTVAGGYGFCGPAGTAEVPDAGWPSSAAGNTVAFGSPISGQTLLRFYYFVVDEFSGAPGPYFCSAVNPTGGYAAFYDPSLPPFEDLVVRFGCVRWYNQGTNDCPSVTTPDGACCDPLTGTCALATQAQCPTPHTWLEGQPCEPNPCPVPPPFPAVCCTAAGNCKVTLESECPLPSIWHPEWTTCVPNYCPPPVPTITTTWGKIKALYR